MLRWSTWQGLTQGVRRGAHADGPGGVQGRQQLQDLRVGGRRADLARRQRVRRHALQSVFESLYAGTHCESLCKRAKCLSYLSGGILTASVG